MDERITRAIIGALRERDRSGYEIWRWIGATHGASSELTEANLYPTLYAMEAGRLVTAEWSEAEGIRRRYRAASRAVTMAQSHGWPAIGRPIRADPMAEAVGTAAAPEPDDHGSSVGDDDENPPADPAAVAADFIRRLDDGLRLSEPYRTEVRSELRDHVEDSRAELERLGVGPAAAAREAVGRLGPPEELAAAANKAQLTRGRLTRGMSRATVTALFGAGLSLAASGTAVLFAPLIARPLESLAAAAGFHVYVPETQEWRAEQFALAATVAAFMAARVSTPVVAHQTRRAESLVRPAWAVAGVIPTLALALLFPARLDLLTAAALLAIPVAFALGVWRSQGVGDDAASRGGVMSAAVIVIVLLFMPGFRVWHFSSTAYPSAAPPPVASAASVSWVQDSGSWHATVSGVDSSQWHDLRLEFWPARRDGLEIEPDQSANGPSLGILPGQMLDFRLLPDHPEDWTVVLTAADDSGTRHSLLADTHLGNQPTGFDNIASWLLRR
jgi:hypothetical protein